MKLHFTSDWLRKHIENDPDMECEAGFPLESAVPLKDFLTEESSEKAMETAEVVHLPNTGVLSRLILQVRRRDKLTIAQLANKIRVEEIEIESIENDVNYLPRPRTLHQIALYLNVPTTSVQRLITGLDGQNNNMENAVAKFAASSNDLSELSRTERRGLNDFVKFLSTLDNGK